MCFIVNMCVRHVFNQLYIYLLTYSYFSLFPHLPIFSVAFWGVWWTLYKLPRCRRFSDIPWAEKRIRAELDMNYVLIILTFLSENRRNFCTTLMTDQLHYTDYGLDVCMCVHTVLCGRPIYVPWWQPTEFVIRLSWSMIPRVRRQMPHDPRYCPTQHAMIGSSNRRSLNIPSFLSVTLTTLVYNAQAIRGCSSTFFIHLFFISLQIRTQCV